MRRILTFWLATASLLTAADDAAQWLRYPTISPDSQTIVFTHDGDLYSVPSSGGTATQLTQHIARDFMPCWSPDSKWIAFASNRHGNYDVYRIPVTGGTAERLTYDSRHDLPTCFTSEGDKIVFSSTRLDDPKSIDMPSRRAPEVYEVPVAGGRVTRIFTTPAESISVNKNGTQALYQDLKGYEDPWRKHHASSVTRDVWLYDVASSSHTKLTDFAGEDRNPVWFDAANYLYLSEQSGSFNVWKAPLNGSAAAEQITSFETHPVRFLSISDSQTLCYGWHGSIYTQPLLENPPVKVEIHISADTKNNTSGASSAKNITNFSLSKDSKEIAYVARGEIFVTSVEHKTTRRITDTPQQERSVDFHPDGRKIVYAAERDGSWNLYTAEIAREEDKAFHSATVINEKALLVSDDETFQPKWSPDGKSVAYIHERTQLKILTPESGAITHLTDGSRAYSYKDGDIEFTWSPDSQNLLTTWLQSDRWAENIAIVPANGQGPIIDLTKNGYYDYHPQWSWNGEAITWISNRHGKKSHGSWGSQTDVYAGFLTDRAYRLFNLSKQEREEIDNEAWEKLFESKRDLSLEDMEDRIERLTIHSTDLAGAILSADGKALYYMIEDRGDHHIWVHKFYEDETKHLASLGKANDRQAADLVISDDGKFLIALTSGALHKIETESGKSSRLKYNSQMTINSVVERQEMFHHIWKQTNEKFHRQDMHGTDWELYGKAYEAFLPAITNNYDFAEMLSEMLGELDASHTGAFYRMRGGPQDKTASLGIFHDTSYRSKGIKVLEVINGGPLDGLETDIPANSIIEMLNGKEITTDTNIAKLLESLTGKRLLLSLHDPVTDKRWEEIIRPISIGQERELIYRRWVKNMRHLVDEKSGGKLGYVHVRSMNDEGFRSVFQDVFGRYSDRKALVIDTRFNGGGWLSEDLTTFLSGQDFLKFFPRGQKGMGGEPLFRWTKPSAVVMGEGNYSDAHIFPFAYKAMNIGKLIGMPVPGTGTAVWWETLIDPSLVFGIPQVSTIDKDGNYLENTQLEPDIEVANSPEDKAAGVDKQIEAAVKHLLSLPDQAEWPFPSSK